MDLTALSQSLGKGSPVARASFAVAALAMLTACGRVGFEGVRPAPSDAGPVDGSRDGSGESESDAPEESGPDAPEDVGSDAPEDVGSDAPEDVGSDAEPCPCFGDVNGDGTVSPADRGDVDQCIDGGGPPDVCTLRDVDCSGVVDECDSDVVTCMVGWPAPGDATCCDRIACE